MKNRIVAKIQRALAHRGIFSLGFDIVLHKLLINTDPRDYFHFGFYKKGKSLEEKSRYVSLRGSKYFPYGNNPLKYNRIFTNKYIQKAIFQHFALPTPALVATIGENLEICSQNQLNTFLDAMQSDIAIKQISGTHGSGFLSLSRKGEALVAGDTIYSKDDVWGHVAQNFKKGYIVEEKIINLESIRAIHPASLNTYRFTFIKTRDGKWHDASCMMKLGTGGSLVDNASAGGIIAEVGADGITVSAHDYLRAKPVTHHPDTGFPLVGIALEGYRQAHDLAVEATHKFYFMGSIGWDIASTASGPVIVEANAWWGNPQKQIGRGIITDELAKGLRKYYVFTRWDKTRMYPGMSGGSIMGRLKNGSVDRPKMG